MKRLLLSLAIVAVAAASCQKDVVYNDILKEKDGVELTATRSYDEALKIAEDALSLLDGIETRSGKKRVIKRAEGQTVMRPVTRGSETTEEPIMYVFNNENDEGFTIVAADRSQQPLIAVTEQGNYTYGEPTGVEPFDLLMEDVANSLIIEPEVDYLFKTEYENGNHNSYGPLSNVQWGTSGIYGAKYPDGIAFDEAAAIAQLLLCVECDNEYIITNFLDPEFNQIFNIDYYLSYHLRNDHTGFLQYCNEEIHENISRLYYEIGFRLSSGTNVGLNNKLTPFMPTQVRNVLSSFGVDPNPIYIYNGETIKAMRGNHETKYHLDAFVFAGLANSPLPDQTNYHYWIAIGFDHYTYDVVEYTINHLLDPNSPFPNEYTETSRTRKSDYMLYLNWGFDGISNGWFYSGCFDMDDRIDTTPPLGGHTSTYDYNFSNIYYFRIPGPFFGGV